MAAPRADPRPLLGALAVVVRDRQVLLARRSKAPDAGLWGFPGGHVEWGETAMAAAVRELHEETGITAMPERYLTGIDVIRVGPDGTGLHYYLAAVACRYVAGAPVAADDVTEATWVACDDVRAGRLPMSDRVAEVMDLAYDRPGRLRSSMTAPDR